MENNKREREEEETVEGEPELKKQKVEDERPVKEEETKEETTVEANGIRESNVEEPSAAVAAAAPLKDSEAVKEEPKSESQPEEQKEQVQEQEQQPEQQNETQPEKSKEPDEPKEQEPKREPEQVQVQDQQQVQQQAAAQPEAETENQKEASSTQSDTRALREKKEPPPKLNLAESRPKRQTKPSQHFMDFESPLSTRTPSHTPNTDSAKRSRSRGRKRSSMGTPSSTPRASSGGRRGSKIPRSVKQAEKVLDKVMKQPLAIHFNTPVDWELLNIPTYPLIVKNPMDLGTVKERIRKGYYRHKSEIARDVQLVWDNSRLFNGEDHWCSEAAGQLEEMWKKGFDPIESEGGVSSEEEDNVDVRIEHLEREIELLKQQKTKKKSSPKPRTKSSTPSPAPRKPAASKKVEKTEPKRARTTKTTTPRRTMSYEEKRKLSYNINKLPSEKLVRVLEIIRESIHVVEDQEEIEIDIEKLDTDTLFKLQKYVKSCLTKQKPNNKKAPKGKDADKKSAPSASQKDSRNHKAAPAKREESSSEDSSSDNESSESSLEALFSAPRLCGQLNNGDLSSPPFYQTIKKVQSEKLEVKRQIDRLQHRGNSQQTKDPDRRTSEQKDLDLFKIVHTTLEKLTSYWKDHFSNRKPLKGKWALPSLKEFIIANGESFKSFMARRKLVGPQRSTTWNLWRQEMRKSEAKTVLEYEKLLSESRFLAPTPRQFYRKIREQELQEGQRDMRLDNQLEIEKLEKRFRKRNPQVSILSYEMTGL